VPIAKPVPVPAPVPVPVPVPAPAPAKPWEPPPQTLSFPDADYRAKQPAPEPIATFKQPKVQRFKLGDGIEVILVEKHVAPSVSMELVMNGGAALDPVGREGLAGVCM